MAHKNLQTRSDYQRAYRVKHRLRRAQIHRVWREKNRQEVDRYQALYRANNRLKRAASGKAWKAKNPEKHRRNVRVAKANRRARKIGVPVNPKAIASFVGRVRRAGTVSCYYCGRKVSGRVAHMDHVMPLKPRFHKESGAHEVGNLCVACPDCNRRKSDKRLADFLMVGQQILKL